MIEILVVEDEQSVAGALKIILEDCGYLVRVAMNGREGFRLAREYRFDVTISDYRLPDTTGTDLLKAVSKINPETSTVLITAHSTPELIADAHDLGIHAVLNKPFPPSEILTLLTSLVERKRVSLSGARVEAATNPDAA